eukprot:1342357-Prorocentrum_lima.AAC.1
MLRIPDERSLVLRAIHRVPKLLLLRLDAFDGFDGPLAWSGCRLWSAFGNALGSASGSALGSASG